MREQLARYLVKELSLEDFQIWFAPVLWNIERSLSRPAVELAYEIALRIAEFSNGHWTQEELRNNLLPLVEKYKVEIESVPRTSSSSKVFHVPLKYPGLCAGRQPSGAF